MKIFLTIFFLFNCIVLQAQTIADFENYNLSPETFLNGSDGSGGFESGGVFLPNDYNSDWMTWSGWAISNTTDVTTAGFTNEYSAITGGGVDGSPTYAVTFAFGNNMMLKGDAAGEPVSGMYITNTTYAFLSMKEGDAFAKKFGGVTGNDPDFFLLTIKAYYNGTLSTDSVDFYLADFRFPNNSQDYIVDEWTWVDLSDLGPADSIAFTLSSSDVGQFGMNTPAYFAVDNITTADPSSTGHAFGDSFNIYPNPTADFIQITLPENETLDCRIFDINGQLVLQKQLGTNGDLIDLQYFASGIYQVKIQGKHVWASQKVVKL